MSKIEKKLEALPSQKLKKNFLSEEYPSLYVLILESLNQTDMIEEYMAACKAYQGDLENYSLYIHGYLLLWFRQQRQAGKLSQGMSNHSFTIDMCSQGQKVEG